MLTIGEQNMNFYLDLKLEIKILTCDKTIDCLDCKFKFIIELGTSQH